MKQSDIDELINNELKNVRFSAPPKYNPYIKNPGKTVAELYPWGEFKKISRIEIGKQSVDTKKELLDTLVHEEIEARIMGGKRQHYRDLMKRNNNAEIHNYIHSVIKKYFTLKGW